MNPERLRAHGKCSGFRRREHVLAQSALELNGDQPVIYWAWNPGPVWERQRVRPSPLTCFLFLFSKIKT